MAQGFVSGGIQIATEVFEPTGVANKGTIILAYGSDGLVDNKNGPWRKTIREHASDLARQGFRALIPDYFLRTGTPPNSIDYAHDGAIVVMTHKDAWQSTLADAVQFAKTQPAIDGSRIGLLGYSLGAYLSLRLRAQAKAVVAFFPPLMDGIGAATTPGLPVDIHYGDKDPLRFESNAGPIAHQLRTDGANVTLHCYPGANHGFSGSDPQNVKASTDSKTRTIEFFKAVL